MGKKKRSPPQSLVPSTLIRLPGPPATSYYHKDPQLGAIEGGSSRTAAPARPLVDVFLRQLPRAYQPIRHPWPVGFILGPFRHQRGRASERQRSDGQPCCCATYEARPRPCRKFTSPALPNPTTAARENGMPSGIVCRSTGRKCFAQGVGSEPLPRSRLARFAPRSSDRCCASSFHGPGHAAQGEESRRNGSGDSALSREGTIRLGWCI